MSRHELTITTERLVLRRWREDDLEPLAKILLHPDVAPWIGAVGATVDDVAAAIERYEIHFEERGYGRLAVVSRESGDLVGRAGPMREPAWTASPCQDELGWAVHPRHWGEGFATEAAAASINDSFDRCGVPGVIAFTTPDNHASRRVMEKCGLELRGATSWKGATHVWYALAAPGQPAA